MSLRLTDHSRSLQLLAKMLFAAILLTGCGGGGSSSSAGPAKSSFTAGAITGFGSVIINGIRFKSSAASVANDDDEAQSETDLKLGMVAEVEAGEITSDSTGSHGDAKSIHFRSAIIGPVNAIDIPTRLLVVLGQTVDVSNTTVFGDSLPNGPNSISVGGVLEIYGMQDTKTGHYVATRIEAKTNVAFYKLRGVVANLDTTARTFMIGGETISFANLPPDQIPADLANGLLVCVKLETTKVGGAWVAIKLKLAAHHVTDHNEIELKGLVTSFTSPTQFSVEGIPVNASNATFVGDSATIVLGTEVEVEGAASNGVIMATKVTIETEGQDEIDGFELHGAIESLKPEIKTFVLRGVTVSYGGSAFKDGVESDLADGRNVEVKGNLSSDGTMIEAKIISFEH